jgi:mannitol/fructose-specific phosphotransferase system IIA component (Ntr-type)
MKNILPEICINLQSTNKNEAMMELASLLFKSGGISDLEVFVKDLQAREGLMSTYCGYHLAIPHSESEVVVRPSFAFGRSKGLQWDEDDEMVKFIIILAIPKEGANQNNQHIDMMSAIATLALEDDVREIWEKAETIEEIATTFNL